MLKSLAELDPNMYHMSQTHERLLSLKSFFEHFIIKESPSYFTAELRNYVMTLIHHSLKILNVYMYGGTKYLKRIGTQC